MNTTSDGAATTLSCNKNSADELLINNGLPKPSRFELLSWESKHKPLINNKELDPDSNYYSNYYTATENDSKYYSPSQVAHKFFNSPPPFQSYT